ncbi:MAG: hypothetical protein HKN17_08145 [Rhodothermales bacterium]|nr:hypothetical protein [Rhodothermales bacterium]
MSALLLSATQMAPRVHAQTPTRILVRAVSNDAKIIGSNVGGVRIMITDPATGSVLADGIQEGNTGDTRLIMTERPPRHETMYDTPGAAHFTAELMLDEPTVVNITAIGPLDNPEATTRSMKQMLLFPGQHVEGEGVIIELNGFTVDWLSPAPNAEHASGSEIPVRARVTMLCGCPTEPGGLWDSNGIDIRVRVISDGQLVQEHVMNFSGETSIYEATLSGLDPGSHRVEITASDAEHANFGRASRTLLVQ